MSSGQRPFDEVFPPFPDGFTMPFWYASLQSLWVYYLVDIDEVRAHLPVQLQGEALEAARFVHAGEEWGLISLDLQRYTGHGPSFLEAVHEVEFNVYAYPQAREPGIPLLTVEQFLAGEDQTKTLGGYRLHVPCDNPNAVQAGRGLFGEPKYLAHFAYTVPGLNEPDVSTWRYAVYQDREGQQGPLLWEQELNLEGLTPRFGDPSPLVEYGVLEEAGARRLVANLWSFYGPFATYHLDPRAAGERVRTRFGTDQDPTGTLDDLRELLGDRAPVAVQAFESAPVSSETRAWYVTPT
jgi:hypothetical protein